MQVAGGGQMRLRSSDPHFLSLVDAWWRQLLPRLAPLTYSRGGPIILVQVHFVRKSCAVSQPGYGMLQCDNVQCCRTIMHNLVRLSSPVGQCARAGIASWLAMLC